jgi:FkbM family methyltransferase
MKLLDLSRSILSRTQVPGRFILAELASRALAPATKRVEGRIGAYAMTFDFRDLLQRQMYFGLYDQAEIRLLKRLLNPGDTFLDIGANVGYYSLVASQLVGSSGHVHAFEPIAQNADILSRTIRRNDISNITVNQVAVGSHLGLLKLFVADRDLGNSGWASVVPSERRPRHIEVEQIAVDDYLRERNLSKIHLAKLDIEGNEPEALEGMRRTLQGADAPGLLCEVSPFLLERRGMEPRHLLLQLLEYGYELYRVSPSGLKPIDLETELDPNATNLYCTKAPHLSADV